MAFATAPATLPPLADSGGSSVQSSRALLIQVEQSLGIGARFPEGNGRSPKENFLFPAQSWRRGALLSLRIVHFAEDFTTLFSRLSSSSLLEKALVLRAYTGARSRVELTASGNSWRGPIEDDDEDDLVAAPPR